MFFEQQLLRTLPDVSMLFRHLAELALFLHLVKTPSEELTAPQLLIFLAIKKN